MRHLGTLLTRFTEFLSVTGVTLSLLSPISVCASTIDPPVALWNGGTAPFISLFTCKNQLSTYFPNSADDMENELVEAAEEWFIGTGANLRFYYLGSLMPGDPACADVPTTTIPRAPGMPPPGPLPPKWSVVLTAAPFLTNVFNVIGDRCLYAATDRWEIPAAPGSTLLTPTIERARITLARGQQCDGGHEWPWFNPRFGPQPQTLSPARVLMKMLGHAMGLNEEKDGATTVMAPIDVTAVDYRWHIGGPIVRVVRAAYGSAQSSPYWSETKDQGKSWKVLKGTPRFGIRNSLGLAACQNVVPKGQGQSRPRYLVAETVLQSDGTSNVITYSVGPDRRTAINERNHGPSNRRPTLVCGEGLFILGMVDTSGQVRIRRSKDGSVWSDSQVPQTSTSDQAPALAVVKWTDGILAVTSREGLGIHYLLSTDAGAIFGSADGSFHSAYQPRFPFGVTCPAAKRRCYLAFGDYGFTVFTDEVQGTKVVGVAVSGGGEIPNLGTALTSSKNDQGYFVVRRYKPGSKFYATPHTALDEFAGGLQADAEAIPWTFDTQTFSRLVSDSPIGIFRDEAYREFTAVGTYNRWYNGYGFVTALRKR